MKDNTDSKNKFVGFEYREVLIKKSIKPLYADNYKNFGWIFEGDSALSTKPDCIQIRFKRDRKIRNKAELTRLQRQFDGYIKEILRLESSKKKKASIVAYVVGVIGTGFMTGSVFAVTAGNVGMCIILAVPAFLGWILPYVLFKILSEKRAEQVNPLISNKYDELYNVCEKANMLLN